MMIKDERIWEYEGRKLVVYRMGLDCLKDACSLPDYLTGYVEIKDGEVFTTDGSCDWKKLDERLAFMLPEEVTFMGKLAREDGNYVGIDFMHLHHIENGLNLSYTTMKSVLEKMVKSMNLYIEQGVSDAKPSEDA